MKKNTQLAIVLVIIILVIWYIEAGKPTPSTTPVQTINTTVSATSSAVSSSTPSVSSTARLALKATKYIPAHELADIQGYINSVAVLPNGHASSTAPFKLADLVGKKVILIDFWTYSCINCLRTIPYVTAWDQKYRNQGLVVVGVHTPEFDFEKDYSNVAAAVKRLGIQYPVVLDNNMGTWSAYSNMYWPHEYLIDIDGYVVHDHIGEGAYDETERAIQAALKERADVLGVSATAVSSAITTPTNIIPMDPSQVQSPETYFGAARNEYLGNGSQGMAGTQNLTLPTSPMPNTLYLGGTWNFSDQFAKNTSPNADIIFNYSSKNVYFVAAADPALSGSSVKVKVFLDGQPISVSQAGSDVGADGTVTVTGNRLYSIVNGAGYGQHVLHLQAQGTGLDAFTFTFG